MRVYVSVASDVEQDEGRKLRWGDYHFGKALERELYRQGHTIVTNEPEVLIHCYGLPAQALPIETYNIIWLHSHPDGLSKEYLQQYDKVYCLSPMYLGKLFEWGIDAELLVGATEFKAMPEQEVWRDVVFVGNAKKYQNDSRPIIDALIESARTSPYIPPKLEVWGEGWTHLPEGVWQGEYYDNARLNELYASSAVVLNDEHDDMQREGFINPRVLDAIAAGSVVVTMPNKAYRELGLPVIEFESVAQVANIVERRKAGKYPAVAMNPYPFSDMAARLMQHIPARKCVDLGCGNHKRPGFVGVDKVKLPGVDLVFDITKQWLLHPDSVDYLVADNVLEHIDGAYIEVMNHAWATVKPTGKFKVIVPSVTTTAAFSDPTHVRYFSPDSFDYFDVDSERWKDYGQSYGIKPWRIIQKAFRDRFIEVVMQPVRDNDAR